MKGHPTVKSPLLKTLVFCLAVHAGWCAENERVVDLTDAKFPDWTALIKVDEATPDVGLVVTLTEVKITSAEESWFSIYVQGAIKNTSGHPVFVEDIGETEPEDVGRVDMSRFRFDKLQFHTDKGVVLKAFAPSASIGKSRVHYRLLEGMRDGRQLNFLPILFAQNAQAGTFDSGAAWLKIKDRKLTVTFDVIISFEYNVVGSDKVEQAKITIPVNVPLDKPSAPQP